MAAPHANALLYAGRPEEARAQVATDATIATRALTTSRREAPLRSRGHRDCRGH